MFPACDGLGGTALLELDKLLRWMSRVVVRWGCQTSRVRGGDQLLEMRCADPPYQGAGGPELADEETVFNPDAARAGCCRKAGRSRVGIAFGPPRAAEGSVRLDPLSLPARRLPSVRCLPRPPASLSRSIGSGHAAAGIAGPVPPTSAGSASPRPARPGCGRPRPAALRAAATADVPVRRPGGGGRRRRGWRGRPRVPARGRSASSALVLTCVVISTAKPSTAWATWVNSSRSPSAIAGRRAALPCALVRSTSVRQTVAGRPRTLQGVQAGAQHHRGERSLLDARLSRRPSSARRRSASTCSMSLSSCRSSRSRSAARVTGVWPHTCSLS